MSKYYSRTDALCEKVEIQKQEKELQPMNIEKNNILENIEWGQKIWGQKINSKSLEPHYAGIVLEINTRVLEKK